MNGSAQQEHIERLRRIIDDVLGPLVPPGRSCALIGFPEHWNVGDNAIWLGETAWLRARGASLAYVSSLQSFSAGDLRAALPEGGTILLHGGGRIGDLYPDAQEFFEAVIRDFPDFPIVQLPQSVYFEAPENAKSTRAAFRDHPAFTLLVRDSASLRRSEEHLGLTPQLCPDMAFALGSLPRLVAPTYDVVWLARVDKERAPTAQPPAEGAHVVDWSRSRRAILGHLLLKRLLRLSHGQLRGALPLEWLVARRTSVYAELASRRVEQGLALLSSGRAVVVDRLHGHILACLLGLPHVVMENRIGKLGEFWETWTSEFPGAFWANDTEEALRLARSLAAAPSEPTPASPPPAAASGL